jgi:hypothetical protein
VDDQYIKRENIALFRRRLLETSDPAARRVLLTLLAEEEAKGDPLVFRRTSGWLQGEPRSPT